jgi:hypothetical protein
LGQDKLSTANGDVGSGGGKEDQRMKMWVKGAIIGGIWSILGFIVEIPIKELAWLEIVFFFPILIAKLLGFVSYAAFLGGPLVGIVIGSFIGFLYDLRKEQKRTGKIELKFSYWQKGAIIGGMWGILATPVYVIIGFRWWEKQTPYFVRELVPIIIYFPAKLVFILFPSTWSPSIFFQSTLNFLGWVIIGAVAGYLYGKYGGVSSR